MFISPSYVLKCGSMLRTRLCKHVLVWVIVLYPFIVFFSFFKNHKLLLGINSVYSVQWYNKVKNNKTPFHLLFFTVNSMRYVPWSIIKWNKFMVEKLKQMWLTHSFYIVFMLHVLTASWSCIMWSPLCTTHLYITTPCNPAVRVSNKKDATCVWLLIHWVFIAGSERMLK